MQRFYIGEVAGELFATMPGPGTLAGQTSEGLVKTGIIRRPVGASGAGTLAGHAPEGELHKGAHPWSASRNRTQPG